MADRQTTPYSPSRSRRNHTESRVARRTSNSLRVNPYPSPATDGDTSARARFQATATQWSWLPAAIETWRTEENIELPAHVGGYSFMDLSPYTQEPTHLTVPVLAARLHRHERQMHDFDVVQDEIRGNWIRMAQGHLGQVYLDQMDLTETMETVHRTVTSLHNEVAVLQTRLEQCETRLRETEEHSHSMEQRLVIAEETLRMVGRLTTTMERVVTLLPPQNQPPNPRQD